MDLPNEIKSDVQGWKCLPRKYFHIGLDIFVPLFIIALFLLLPPIINGKLDRNIILGTLFLLTCVGTLFIFLSQFYHQTFLNRIELIHPEFLVKEGEVNVLLRRFSNVMPQAENQMFIVPINQVEFLWEEITRDIFFFPAGITSKITVLMIRINGEHQEKILEDYLIQNSNYVLGARRWWNSKMWNSHPYITCCINLAQFELWTAFLSHQGISIQGTFPAQKVQEHAEIHS